MTTNTEARTDASSPTAAAPVSLEGSREIAAMLIESGVLAPADLDYALRVHTKLANPRPLVSDCRTSAW
ncbi:MAG: hypothetical protein IPG61_17615 [bacterium]|nr:hypothetical protein [bacterium]